MLYVAIILFVLVSMALTVLVIQNLLNDVSLSLLIWQPHMSLCLLLLLAFSFVGLLLLLAFGSGALMLYFVSAPWASEVAREVKSLRLRAAELEQPAANANTI